MEISFSSIFSAVLSVSLLTSLLFLIMRRKNVVTSLGLGCMYFLLILILFRGLLPVDFYAIGLTTSIYSEQLLPRLRDFFLTKLFSFNKFSISPLKLILALWINGSIFRAYSIIKSYLTASKIAKFSLKVTDVRISNIFQNALETIWAKQHPDFQLVQNDSFGSPALFGIGKPVIILPHLNYTEEELYLVCYHELLHYKHKDFILKLLVDIMRVIYWWNPLIHLLFSSLVSQIQELLVDHHISNTNTKDQRIRYMQTLTTTLKHKEQYSNLQTTDNPIILLTDNHKNSFIRQRFDYIKTKDIKAFTLYGVVMCLALFLSSYTIVFEPSYNISTDENGDPVFEDLNGQTYFIRNDDKYDFYMQNEYVVTLDQIPEEFKDVPIYNNQEEVPQNEN